MCLLVAGCQLWRVGSLATIVGGRPPKCGDGSCTAAGCVAGPQYSRCFDEHVAARGAIKRADRSLKACYARRPPVDFQDGYRQAFIDIALGGRGQVPAVPPERYWSTCYRTAEGHQLAQHWFAGYAAGGARALSLPRYQFNEVAASVAPGFDDHAAHCPAGLRGAPSDWMPEPPRPQ